MGHRPDWESISTLHDRREWWVYDPPNIGRNIKTAHTTARNSHCVASSFGSATFSVLHEQLSGFFVPSSWFCTKANPTCSFHASFSRVKCPLVRSFGAVLWCGPVVRGKARTDADTSLSFNVRNASCPSFIRGSNVFGPPFSGFSLSSAAMRAKFRTNRQYTLHKMRKNFNSVTFLGGFKSRIESVV